MYSTIFSNSNDNMVLFQTNCGNILIFLDKKDMNKFCTIIHTTKCIVEVNTNLLIIMNIDKRIGLKPLYMPNDLF